MTPFNKPLLLGTEASAVSTAILSPNISGGGKFTQQCEKWISESLHGAKVFLTTSGTAALELAAMLCDIHPGDEVIAPSYTFVSTVNAFVLRGAKVVFVDVNDTMNLDATQIEAAITDRTRVIVPVQYNGVACDMDVIMTLADRHGLRVVEDAAQALGCTQHGRAVGSRGHLACFSFHETKNLTAAGQGGALAVNDPSLVARAEVAYGYGTDRARCFRGEIPHYQWIGLGSNATLSEPQAAFLWVQLQAADRVGARRRQLWAAYRRALEPLHAAGHLMLPPEPEGAEHVGHLFFFRLPSGGPSRVELSTFMKRAGVSVAAHYGPLHAAPFGREHGRFAGKDRNTTAGSESLVRLPMFYALEDAEQNKVIESLKEFFEEQGTKQTTEKGNITQEVNASR